MQPDFYEEFRQRVEGKRLLILGVGNRSRSDDGLGSRLAERLKGRISVPLIDAGSVPEHFLRQVETLQADLVLVLDTADLRAAPGDIALLELSQIGGLAISTHTVNLPLLFKVIPISRRPKVFVLAVQPEITDAGTQMSLTARNAMQGLESLLLGIFS
ncbi:MAG: Hydrogenase 3 maturation protease [Anaerolineales bacterium]|nr:Hydrogenase 3 maturation protease [Anaerolineales bacterium]